MKTIKQILLATSCICLLFACSKSNDTTVTPNSDQGMTLKKNIPPDYDNSGTATYAYDYPVEGTETLPVFCGEEQVDQISITNFAYKVLEHSQKGEIIWEYLMRQKWVMTSDWTGEVFKVQGFEKYMIKAGWDQFNLHMVGDQGHVYINKILLDINTWEVLKMQAVCKVSKED